MSVATPDAFFGHAIHSIPASSSFGTRRSSVFASAAFDITNASAKSNAPRRLSRVVAASAGASVASTSDGASTINVRCAAFSPSFAASGVPE